MQLSSLLTSICDFAYPQWFTDVHLYGLCVESCPVYDAAVVETIHDYGYGVSSECSAADWTVYMSTVDLFNRCIQESERQSITVNLCTIPNCTEAGATCYSHGGDVGVPAGAWEIDNSGIPASVCQREVAFTYGAQVMQPGATAYLDWLFSYVRLLASTA